MEYLDIVNERDEVIGRAEKEEAHGKRLLHRFVHILIVDSKGNVLVQRRGRHVKRGALLLDASVGGHVSSGQTYEEAAAREMREELGVTAPLRYLFDIDDRSSPHEYQIGRCFLAHHDGPFKADPREVEDVRFYSPQEIQRLMDSSPHLFTKGFISTFMRYLEHNGWK